MDISDISPRINNAGPYYDMGSGASYSPLSGDIQDSQKVSGADNTKKSDIDHIKKPGYRSSPAECQTCKNRKYQDGSDENVSFKAATHISPEAAPAAVMAHEGEHVTNAYIKAAQKNGKVISASVSIHTSVCPECGRVYVSGGTTTSVIKYPSSQQSDRSSEKENFNT